MDLEFKVVARCGPTLSTRPSSSSGSICLHHCIYSVIIRSMPKPFRKGMILFFYAWHYNKEKQYIAELKRNKGSFRWFFYSNHNWMLEVWLWKMGSAIKNLLVVGTLLRFCRLWLNETGWRNTGNHQVLRHTGRVACVTAVLSICRLVALESAFTIKVNSWPTACSPPELHTHLRLSYIEPVTTTTLQQIN